MTYNPEIHHRHSIRLKGYDYSQAGAYFVTLCASERQCLFGEITNSKMILNEAGRIVAEEWKRIKNIRNNVVLDEFVIMPNHFHSIIFFTDSVGATPTVIVGAMPTARPKVFGKTTGICDKPKTGRPVGIAPTGPVSGSIGAIMAQFKSIVTKRVNAFRNNPGGTVWQRNYYERVIRNENELSRAREYIVNNPLKWDMDKENPIHCR